MTVLQLVLVVLNVVAFTIFVLTFSAVFVQAAAGEGPIMRQSRRSSSRRIMR